MKLNQREVITVLNDSYTTQRYPLRHPDNPNLHLHYEDTFQGLPIQGEVGPFIRECLSELKRTIDLALAEYPRVLAFRVDLRLPQDVELPDFAYTNLVISRFFESFTKKIQYHQERVAERGYSRGCKVRYVWSREIGQAGRQHYHLLILLNRDAYYSLGLLRSERVNMISRIEESWASALGLSKHEVDGLVHIPDNPTYRIDRHPRMRRVAASDRKVLVDELPDLFHRASYLCKKATKSYGDRQRGFGTSRG